MILLPILVTIALVVAAVVIYLHQLVKNEGTRPAELSIPYNPDTFQTPISQRTTHSQRVSTFPALHNSGRENHSNYTDPPVFCIAVNMPAPISTAVEDEPPPTYEQIKI